MNSFLTDIFNNPVNIGDKVAVGMAYHRSSVLRVGEVLSIKETDQGMSSRGEPMYKWSIRIKWTHNGEDTPSQWTTRDSTILHESTHTYAKLLVLPKDFVDQYPAQIL